MNPHLIITLDQDKCVKRFLWKLFSYKILYFKQIWNDTLLTLHWKERKLCWFKIDIWHMNSAVDNKYSI